MKTSTTNKVIILLAAGLVMRALFYYHPPVNTLKVGDTAPAFSLSLTDGGILSSEALKEKPSVLFFYANWCPCSHETAPLIQRAYQEYKERDVNFLSIGIQDTESDLKDFVRRHEFTFNTGLDNSEKIANAFGVTITPTTIIIGRDGKITGLIVGKIKTYEAIKEKVNEIFI